MAETRATLQRRHYELIARTIAWVIEHHDGWGDISVPERFARMWLTVERQPNFDAERFLLACGLTEEHTRAVLRDIHSGR